MNIFSDFRSTSGKNGTIKNDKLKSQCSGNGFVIDRQTCDWRRLTGEWYYLFIENRQSPLGINKKLLREFANFLKTFASTKLFDLNANKSRNWSIANRFSHSNRFVFILRCFKRFGSTFEPVFIASFQTAKI